MFHLTTGLTSQSNVNMNTQVGYDDDLRGRLLSGDTRDGVLSAGPAPLSSILTLLILALPMAKPAAKRSAVLLRLVPHEGYAGCVRNPLGMCRLRFLSWAFTSKLGRTSGWGIMRRQSTLSHSRGGKAGTLRSYTEPTTEAIQHAHIFSPTFFVNT